MSKRFLLEGASSKKEKLMASLLSSHCQGALFRCTWGALSFVDNMTMFVLEDSQDDLTGGGKGGK